MSKASELFTYLIATGPKLKEAWPHVENGVTHFRDGVEEFQVASSIITGLSEAETREVAMSAEEKKLADELNGLLAADGVSGTEREGFFSDIFAWLAAHPKVAELILAMLLAKK